jgi:hypothetical protein
VTGQRFLAFPTRDSLLEGSSIILSKKCSDIGIILELLGYIRRRSFLAFGYLSVCGNRISVCFPGICFEPSLKFHVKFETGTNDSLKESAVMFAATEIFFND